MAGQYSVFATHKGKKVKKVLSWTAMASVAFIGINAMSGGGTGTAEDQGYDLSQSASHFGVETIAVADADESKLKQAEAAKTILNSEEKDNLLVIAGMPADPFQGSAPVAYGSANSERMSINIPANGGENTAEDGGNNGNPDSTEAADSTATPGDPTDSTSAPATTSGSQPSAAATQSSGKTTPEVPEGDPLDGYEVGGGQTGSPSSGKSMSTESRAAADAATAFIKAYTNYDATKTDAEKFSAGLPSLTSGTRAEILKQTSTQWDRLAKDHRVSEGKIEGEPSMSVPADGDKAIVTVQLSIREYGQTTNDQYRSSYTITMVKNNNEWLVDGVTANNL